MALRVPNKGHAPGTVPPARVPSRAGGGAWHVKASAESLGGTGSCGHPISAFGYSELSTVPEGTASDFKALGNLPCGTVLTITNPANGQSVRAAKQDVGSGSPGFLPVMGLYPGTVKQLGLTGGEFNVIIQRDDGGPLRPVRGTPAGAGAGTGTGSTGASTPSNGGGGTPSLLSVLSDLVTGDIGDLAASLAMMVAVGIKDVAVGFADMVIDPLWHRNQQAVWYYATNVLLPGRGSAYQAWQTWPANAAFWGFGYALLFTDPTTGSWKPVPPRQSRIARHVRRGQGMPARRSLVKPARVREKTPHKPKAHRSRARVSHVQSLHTIRAGRPVQVRSESIASRESERPARTGAATPPVISEVRVERDRTVQTEGPDHNETQSVKPHPKSYPHYPGRKRPRTDSQMVTGVTPKASERVRRAAEHRGNAESDRHGRHRPRESR